MADTRVPVVKTENIYHRDSYSSNPCIQKSFYQDYYWMRGNVNAIFEFRDVGLFNWLDNNHNARLTIKYADGFLDPYNGNEVINKEMHADANAIKNFIHGWNGSGGGYDHITGYLDCDNGVRVTGTHESTVGGSNCKEEGGRTKLGFWSGVWAVTIFGAADLDKSKAIKMGRCAEMTLELWIDSTQKHYTRYTYFLENESKLKAYKYQKTDLSLIELHYDKEEKNEKTDPKDYIFTEKNANKGKLQGSYIFTSDTTESFEYKFKDVNGNDCVVKSDDINVIQITGYEIKVDAVKVGDKINVQKLFESCKFDVLYQDGTRYNSTEAEFDLKFSLLVNGVVYTEDVIDILPSYKNNMVVKLIARYGEKTPVTVQCNVQVDDVEDYPITWELKNNQTDFTYGDSFTYGASAVLKTYNYKGDLITTLTGHNAIHNYVNKYNLTAYFDGEVVTLENPIQIVSDGEQIISLKNGEIEVLRIGIYTTYPEPAFKITRQNKTWQVNEGTGLDLKATNEIQKVEVVYHNNHKGSETTKTYLDVTSTVNWDKSVVTLSEAYVSDVARILLSIQKEYMIESRVEINLFANIPVEIEVTEDTSETYKTYWSYKSILIDSGTNLNFSKPTNLTFKLVYKDGTKKPVSLGVYYKNNKYSSVKLNDGDKLNESFTNVAVCYDYADLGDMTLYGLYNLHLENDYITNLTVRNIKQIYYGNYLTKDDIEVMATIGNGTDTRITKPIDYYTFFKVERILSTPSSLKLLVDEMTFNVSGTDLDLTFNKPTFKDCEFIRNNIKLAYVNNTTNVDLSSGQISISYNETDYIETIPFNTTYISSVTAYRNVGGTISSIPIASFMGSDPFRDTFPTGTDIYDNCYFEITFKGDLMSSDKTVSNVLPFYLINTITITGLTIMDAKTEYNVGDKFLNDTDNTLVHIITTNSSFNIPLRYDFPLLIVNPSRGTQFTTTSASTNVTVTYTASSTISTQYSIKVSAKGYTSNSETLTLAVVHIKQFPNHDRYKNVKDNILGYLALIDINDTIVSNNKRIVNVNDPYYYGYIDNYFTTDYNSRVVLFDDFIPESEAESNITVKFPSYTYGQADNINNCHFGILFGANNATNRLFVSGNKNLPNADFHSAELNVTNIDGEVSTTNGDFSYFAWESIMYYGETDNKVIGYDIVSNDKLLVLKSESDKEKTIYFRTPITLEGIDASGNTVKDINGNAIGQEEFALVKGNNSNAGINPKAVVNFNGDTLFIDQEKQLVGLDLTGIVGDSQRYANSKSIYIDRKLKEYDLSESMLFTNQNYLILTVKDLGLFITHYSTKSSENGQYEWWLLNCKNPTCFISIGDNVYFGNDDGAFYSFNNGIYKDLDKLFANGSACIYDYDEEKCYIDNSIIKQLNPDYIYHFKTTEKPIYYAVGRISNNKNNAGEIVALWVNNDANRLELLEDKLSLPCNAQYYLNHIDGEKYIDCDTDMFKTYGDIYKLEQLENPKHFVLKKLVNGVYIDTNIRELNNAVLCRKVTNGEMCDIDTTNSCFKLKDDFGVVANIVQYGLDMTRSFNGEIIKYSNVEAFYITAPFTMGMLDHIKTIWSFTLTNDSQIPSELEVAYASNKIPNSRIKTLASISKEDIGLDMSDFSFKKADFDKGVVPRTYTTNRVLARQRFTCFCFKNFNDTNSVLSAMSVLYSVPFKNYGGD